MDPNIIRKAARNKIASARASQSLINQVKPWLGIAAGLTLVEELLRGAKRGVNFISHESQENPRWKKLLARFPEFGIEDQVEINKEIFKTIHDLSPTVSKNPTMAAQMLHAAREYGLPGLDINTAKTLADIEKSRSSVWKIQTEMPKSPASSTMDQGIRALMT